jgi:hypothetical protein
MAISNCQPAQCQCNTSNTPIIWFQDPHERYVPRNGGEIAKYLTPWWFIIKKMQFYDIPSSCPELNDNIECYTAVN